MLDRGVVGEFARLLMEHLRGVDPATPTPEEELAELLGGARTEHPDVRVPEERFALEVITRLPSSEPVAALRKMRVADLYLAIGCAIGDEAAIAAFERRNVPEIRAVLTRMGLSGADAEETVQVMREELFVPSPGKRPLVLGYAGRGALRTWLRTVAGRTGLRVLRRKGKGLPLNEEIAGSGSDDLELEYLKKTYGVAFQSAFRQALQAMQPKDRVLLKQRLRHHLSIEELGALYRVHPATVSRRVTEARERLVTATREAMMRDLHVGRVEVSSILRLIQSEIDISLSAAPSLAPGDTG